MEAKTNIAGIFAGSKIAIPDYQRAYSWETPSSKTEQKHIDVFISDLEDYNKSSAKTAYYFGHFLFEKQSENEFNVIDGQQRLTTITMFLAATFTRLKAIRSLSEEEEVIYEDVLVRRSIIRFSTVSYDNLLFKDYVILQTKKDKNGLETESQKRIVKAFDYFTNHLADKEEAYLLRMIKTITEATFTTHLVTDESEAIQMFIFQNNRGKKPSNLEIIKAQFMYNAHLYGLEESDVLIKDIKDRFEKIYKSISAIEHKINEDEVLNYTLRVFFNSLNENNAIAKINNILSEADSLVFIKEFTYALSTNFDYLKIFFGKDEKENINIHSLVTLGGFGIAMPFVLKAYSYGANISVIGRLCRSLESLVLRHRLIGTRAEMISRINDVFKNLKTVEDIEAVIGRIDWMKTETNWWWAYWNNTELEKTLQGGINHSIAKFLLWKYENHLESKESNGYVAKRFDSIENPELEHIAPKTEPSSKPHGYDDYDDKFNKEYLNCLGNYLLTSKSHNASIGNIVFSEKLKTYSVLKQQREVQELVSENKIWNKDVIDTRKEKIIKFIMSEF